MKDSLDNENFVFEHITNCIKNCATRQIFPSIGNKILSAMIK